MKEFIVQSRQEVNGKWVGAGTTFVKGSYGEEIAQTIHYIENFETKSEADEYIRKMCINNGFTEAKSKN